MALDTDIPPLDTSASVDLQPTPEVAEEAQQTQDARGQSLPQPPKDKWKNIVERPAYQSLAPEQKMEAATAYASKVRDYKQSQIGADPDAIDGVIHDFLRDQHASIFPEQPTDTSVGHQALNAGRAAVSELESAGLETAAGALRASKPEAFRPINPEQVATIDKQLADESLPQEERTRLEGIKAKLAPDSEFMQTRADEQGRVAGLEKAAAGSDARISVDPKLNDTGVVKTTRFLADTGLALGEAAVPGIGVPLMMGQDAMRRYEQAYTQSGGDEAAAKAALGKSLATNLVFLGQAHGITSGLEAALARTGEKGALKGFLVKALGGSAGNVLTGQATKLAEGGDVNDLSGQDAAQAVAFGIIGAKPLEALQKFAKQYALDKQQATKYAEAGLPMAAEAQTEAADAGLKTGAAAAQDAFKEHFKNLKKEVTATSEEPAAKAAGSSDEPAPGFVRLYHGGSADQAGSDFTPLRDYAEGYAAKSGAAGKVWHVDVPEDAPFLRRDEGANNMLINRQVLPDEIADQAKVLPAANESSPSAATAAVEPAVTRLVTESKPGEEPTHTIEIAPDAKPEELQTLSKTVAENPDVPPAIKAEMQAQIVEEVAKKNGAAEVVAEAKTRGFDRQMSDDEIGAAQKNIDAEIAKWDDRADEVGGIDKLPDDEYRQRKLAENLSTLLDTKREINGIPEMSDKAVVDALERESSARDPKTVGAQYVRSLGAEAKERGLWDLYAKRHPQSAEVIAEQNTQYDNLQTDQNGLGPSGSERSESGGGDVRPTDQLAGGDTSGETPAASTGTNADVSEPSTGGLNPGDKVFVAKQKNGAAEKAEPPTVKEGTPPPAEVAAVSGDGATTVEAGAALPSSEEQSNAVFDAKVRQQRSSEAAVEKAKPQAEQRPAFWRMEQAKKVALEKGISPEEALADGRAGLTAMAGNGAKYAISKKQPFHADYTDAPFNLKPPKGYVREGNRYIYEALPAVAPHISDVPPSVVSTSDQAHQRTTTQALKEVAPKTDPEEVAKRYAVLNKLLNDYGVKNENITLSVGGHKLSPFDLLQDDLVANVRKTGDPFTTTTKDGREVPYRIAGTGDGQMGRIESKLIDALRKSENKLKSGQRVDGEAADGEAPTVQQTVPAAGLNPEQAAERAEAAPAIDGEHPYEAAIRQAQARHFGAFAKATDLPLDAAPGATKDQIVKASMLAANQTWAVRTGQPDFTNADARGIKRGSPVDKLVRDPAFRKAVEQRVVNPIVADIKAAVPRDRAAVQSAAGEVTTTSDKPLYHVTTADRLAKIAAEGLRPDAKRAIGAPSLDGHAKGKVFLTSEEGHGFWSERAEQFIEHSFDDYDKKGIAPVTLRIKGADGVETDSAGTTDARADAFASKKPISPDRIEVWDGEKWTPIRDAKIDASKSFDDAGYLNSESALSNPKFTDSLQSPAKDAMIVRELRGGKSVETVARENSMSQSQVEQVYDRTIQEFAAGAGPQLVGPARAALSSSLRERTVELNKAYATHKGVNGALERIAAAPALTDEARMQKLLASALSKVGENATVLIDPLLLPKENAMGDFDPTTGAIRISPSQPESSLRATFLHEKIHSLTYAKVEAFLQGDHDLLKPSDLKALNELEAIRQQVLEHPDVPESLRKAAAAQSIEEQQRLFSEGDASRSQYGLLSLHEFMSELGTNGEFQSFLNKIKADGVTTTSGAKGTTVWGRIKQLLRQLVFGDRKVAEGSALAVAFDHTVDLLSTGTLDDQLAARSGRAVRSEGPNYKLDQERQSAFLSDFAKEHGYASADEMAVQEPELFSAASEIHGKVDAATPKLFSVAAREPEVIDGTEKRAEKLFGLIDRTSGFEGKSADVIREALSNGAATAPEFAQVLKDAGLKSNVADAAGLALESHLKIEASERAVELQQEQKALTQAKSEIAAKPVTTESLTKLEQAKAEAPPVHDPADKSAQALNLLPHFINPNEPLAKAWQVTKNYFGTKKPSEWWSAWNNAADTKAVVFSEQKTNDVRGTLREAMGRGLKDAKTNLDAKALSFVVETKNDPAKLAEFKQKITDAFSTLPADKQTHSWLKAAHEALAAIGHAEKNFSRLATAADAYNKTTGDQIALEHLNGMNTPFREGYVPHLQDLDKDFEVLFDRGGGVGGATGFKKMRSYETFADSIAAGVKPESLNALDLLNNRLRKGNSVLNKQQWAESGKSLIDPTTKTPLVADPLVETHPVTGDSQTRAPQGYQLRMLGSRTISVHDGYAGLFDAFTAPSAIRQSAVGRAALATEGAIKHGMLLFDTYHLGRLAFYQMPLRGAATFRKGLLMSDYSAGELQNMERRGELPSGVKAVDLIARKADVDLLVKHGYNVGSIQETINNDLIRNLPVIGGFNKFVFQEFQRGGMIETGLMELNRQRKAFGELSEDQVARKVARELNTRFGNLQKEGWLKSATARDLAQLILLAPSWNEGLLRSELGAGAELAKSGYDLATKRQLRAGSLLKGAGTMMLGTFVLNQVINYATRGQPTWMNKEDGFNAKISAWIPDYVGGGPGYFLNPFTLPTELAHQAMEAMDRGSTPMQAVAQVAGYKLAPVARAVDTFRNRTDRFGRPLTSDWDVAKEMLSDVAPAPISGGSLLAAGQSVGAGKVKEPFKGAIEKQAFSTLGVKLDSAPSDISRVGKLAKEFNKARGVTPDPRFASSDYSELTQALNVNDEERARKAFDKLAETKTQAQIYTHYNRQVLHPFTGSGRFEHQFFKSLSTEEKDAYHKAVQAKRQLRDNFRALKLKVPRRVAAYG